MIVFLDSGIIGLLSSPNDRELALNCQSWLYRLLAKSVYVVSSDICDYEVRRGLELALPIVGEDRILVRYDDRRDRSPNTPNILRVRRRSQFSPTGMRWCRSL
jgi:hypothetical protein